jgi:uncharacterized LabA/DUF88 family protein
METQDQIAVFLDIENFIGFCHRLNIPVDLSEILEKLKEEGRIIIRRSFGDVVKSLSAIGQYNQADSVRRMLRDNLFVHEDIAYQNQFKNSADMRLAVEMLYTSYTIPAITKFALIAGDSDYVPVFQKIQEQNKTVIGISGSETGTSVIYRRSCDRVYYVEDLSKVADEPPITEPNVVFLPAGTKVTPGAQEASTPSKIEQATSPTEETLKDEYASLLVRAVKILEQDGRECTMQHLLVQMRQLQSDFNYERAGFDTLLDLAKFAQEQNLVSLEKRGGVVRVFLPEGSSSLPDQAISTAQYRHALQEKLKCQLPPSKTRMAISQQAFENIGFCIVDGGVLLRDLSLDVADDLAMANLNVPQPEVFKYLLSLYRSRCFEYQDNGGGDYNPLITGFKSQVDQWDDQFVVSQSRQLVNEGLPLYPETLSKLFYESSERASYVKRLLDLNGIRYVG